jgi:hypothetical protein
VYTCVSIYIYIERERESYIILYLGYRILFGTPAHPPHQSVPSPGSVFRSFPRFSHISCFLPHLRIVVAVALSVPLQLPRRCCSPHSVVLSSASLAPRPLPPPPSLVEGRARSCSHRPLPTTTRLHQPPTQPVHRHQPPAPPDRLHRPLLNRFVALFLPPLLGLGDKRGSSPQGSTSSSGLWIAPPRRPEHPGSSPSTPCSSISNPSAPPQIRITGTVDEGHRNVGGDTFPCQSSPALTPRAVVALLRCDYLNSTAATQVRYLDSNRC